MPAAATAQPSKLECAYVVLGPQGALARLIVADATRCPSISIDGSEQAMKVRALPDAAFPVLVCELLLTTGAKSAHIAGVENVPLPVVGDYLNRGLRRHRLPSQGGQPAGRTG